MRAETSSQTPRPRRPQEPHRFIVAQQAEGWAVSHGQVQLAVYGTEWQALKAADAAALQAYREGHDARVLTRSARGEMHIDRSYGRHPDLD
jgi:hypothetical protein